MPDGYGPRPDGTGDRWVEGDMTFTVNNADDPAAGDNGYYLSMHDNQTGQHATAVYDQNGNLVDFKPSEAVAPREEGVWDADCPDAFFVALLSG